jgi:hypothetical protein
VVEGGSIEGDPGGGEGRFKTDQPIKVMQDDLDLLYLGKQFQEPGSMCEHVLTLLSPLSPLSHGCICAGQV